MRKRRTRAWVIAGTLAWVLAHAGPADAQSGYGPFAGYVSPTSTTIHEGIVILGTLANGAGFMIDVGGQSGSTTINGDAVYMVDSLGAKHEFGWFPVGLAAVDGSSYALSSGERFRVTGKESARYLAEKISFLVATTAHESYHKDYTAFFFTWCAQNPVDCAAFVDCLTNQGVNPQYLVFSNPCDEAYAAGKATEYLCEELCRLQADPYPDQADLRDELQKRLDEETASCESHSSQCAACSGPLPTDHAGCGPCACP